MCVDDRRITECERKISHVEGGRFFYDGYEIIFSLFSLLREITTGMIQCYGAKNSCIHTYICVNM